MGDSPPTRLESVELSNFRCFDFIKVDFHERLTVIVAPNGGGKTALLEGIAIALKPFVEGLPNLPRTVGIRDTDIRRERTLVNSMEPCVPVCIQARGLGMVPEKANSAEWLRKRIGRSSPTKTTSSDIDFGVLGIP